MSKQYVSNSERFYFGGKLSDATINRFYKVIDSKTGRVLNLHALNLRTNE